MRIGYLTYGLDRSPTGIGRYAIELVKALTAQASTFEIVLLTTELEDHHDLWNKLEHHGLPGCRLLPGLLTVGNVIVSQAIRRWQLDIVHDPNGVAPFLGPAMGAKRIVTIHDAFAYVYPEAHNRLDNWRYRWMLKKALQKTDIVLTDSTNSRNDLLHHLGVSEAQTKVIFCGLGSEFKPTVDTSSQQAIIDKYGLKKPYLLYVGGINARKNIARLFEAYARIRNAHPNMKLVVGGKRQWQTGEIDAAFQRFNLENDVLFTGYVADKDLPALYSAAEAFMFPSLYEGFGLPPLEAMACGTPVITSNVSSLPEVVGDAAIMVDPYDIDAIANAMQRVLENPVLAADLRAKGLARAAQFTWERTARETIAVYEGLLNNQSTVTDKEHATHQARKSA